MNSNYVPTDLPLKTMRLVLRYPDINNAASILSVVKLPQFPEYLPLKEMSTVGEVEAWLKRLQSSWTKGLGFSWIIENQASLAMVGQVTLTKTDGKERWALAFWTHPDHWGKGYATEAAERVLAFGFEVLGAECIWAGAGKWNQGSMRVLEKIGMSYIGDNPQGYFSRGKPIATRTYEISREKWHQKTYSE